MRMRLLTAVTLGAALFVGVANAQPQPATPAAPAAPAGPPNLDAVPDKMPWSTPYGTPISAQKAEAAVRAAAAEATKRGWALNIAVYDSGASLVSFLRMDGAQTASVAIAQHKARVAVTYRRPTKVFEDAVQKAGLTYILTLDDVIASRGGIPLIENGAIIGAIGCSGGTGSQDDVVCQAGAATINK